MRVHATIDYLAPGLFIMQHDGEYQRPPNGRRHADHLHVTMGRGTVRLKAPCSSTVDECKCKEDDKDWRRLFFFFLQCAGPSFSSSHHCTQKASGII